MFSLNLGWFVNHVMGWACHENMLRLPFSLTQAISSAYKNIVVDGSRFHVTQFMNPKHMKIGRASVLIAQTDNKFYDGQGKTILPFQSYDKDRRWEPSFGQMSNVRNSSRFFWLLFCRNWFWAWLCLFLRMVMNAFNVALLEGWKWALESLCGSKYYVSLYDITRAFLCFESIDLGGLAVVQTSEYPFENISSFSTTDNVCLMQSYARLEGRKNVISLLIIS